MRLVAWNCNMALHRKLDALRRLRPDVAVVSECAKPQVVAERAGVENLGADSVWIGRNQHKGLADGNGAEFESSSTLTTLPMTAISSHRPTFAGC